MSCLESEVNLNGSLFDIHSVYLIVNTVNIHHKAHTVNCDKINIYQCLEYHMKQTVAFFEQNAEVLEVKAGVLCSRKCD
jgi:hypothetical protein